MKTKLITAMVLLFAVVSAFGAERPNTGNIPIALTIVIDTSWSCDQHMADFRTLSRQAVSALRPGDYLEVISLDSARPRINLAQTIKAGDAEEIKGIDDVTKHIRSPLLSNATTSNGVKMAFERMADACAKKGIADAAVIMFTDGQLNDSDARRVIEFSEKMAKKNWPLHLTGSKSTNRNILIAANKRKLNWSLLGEANPDLWLQAVRQKGSEIAQKPSDSPETTRILETVDSPIPQARLDDHGPSEHTPETEQQAPDSAEYHETHPEPRLSSWPPDESVKTAQPEQERAEEANEPSTASSYEPQEAPPEPALPRPSWWARFKRLIGGYWLLLLALGAAGVGLVVAASVTASRARNWERKVGRRLKSVKAQSQGTLIARVNGQSYQLGQLDRFRNAHIGSGRSCSVRIAHNSVKDRHIAVFRKAGQLAAKNLAKSPVVVRNTTGPIGVTAGAAANSQSKGQAKQTLGHLRLAGLGREKGGSLPRFCPVWKEHVHK